MYPLPQVPTLIPTPRGLCHLTWPKGVGRWHEVKDPKTGDGPGWCRGPTRPPVLPSREAFLAVLRRRRGPGSRARRSVAGCEAVGRGLSQGTPVGSRGWQRQGIRCPPRVPRRNTALLVTHVLPRETQVGLRMHRTHFCPSETPGLW